MPNEYQQIYNQNPNPQQPNGMMKPCKHCRQMIDKRATVCPYCRKKQGNLGCLIAILVVVSLPLLLLIMASMGTRTRDEGSTTIQPTNQSVQNESQSEVSVTETAQSDFSYEVTDTSFHYYQNSIGKYEYYGIVEITNTGSANIYLDDCTFDLEDNDGHLLQSDNFMISACPEVVKPGEKGYFYNNIGSTSIDDSISLENGVNLVPNFKIESAYGESVDYEVTDTEMREDDYGYTKITGRVTNNTDEDDSMCYIEFLFKDANGKVLFIFGTNVMDLTAGSTKSFDASAMFTDESINKDDIASYEVIARKHYSQF